MQFFQIGPMNVSKTRKARKRGSFFYLAISS